MSLAIAATACPCPKPAERKMKDKPESANGHRAGGGRWWRSSAQARLAVLASDAADLRQRNNQDRNRAMQAGRK